MSLSLSASSLPELAVRTPVAADDPHRRHWGPVTVRIVWDLVGLGIKPRPQLLREVREHALLSLGDHADTLEAEDVASAALKTTTDLVTQIKSKLVAARQPGIDRTKVQAEITQLQNQIRSVADSSTFSGQNWLAVDSSGADYNATKNIVASFTRSSSAVSIGTIDVDTSTMALYDANSGGTGGIIDKSRDVGATTGIKVSTLDISALTDSTTDQTTLDNYISATDAALTDVTTAASDLGAVKTRITMQSDFVSNLMDAVTKGIGQLVDADMNTESTRLQALQVQQQLGVQSLSIANQSSQQILSLFKG